MRETQNLLIAVGYRSISRPSRVFVNSRPISLFFALSRAAFCRVFASVREASLRLCVTLAISKRYQVRNLFFRLTTSLTKLVESLMMLLCSLHDHFHEISNLTPGWVLVTTSICYLCLEIICCI